jgi:ABC-2 type transport system permease protein
VNENLRIIWAITAKDLLEALKNKTTLFNIVVVFLMMVVYKELPEWEQRGQPLNLLVYDAGTSVLVERLEESSAVNLYEYPTREELEEKLSSADEHKLGVIIPADFDRQVESGGSAELSALRVRWISQSATDKLGAQIEEEITGLVGRPVQIDLEQEPVDVDPGRGSPLYAAMLSVIFALVMISIGVVPHLMIEEKQTRTLDALRVSPAGSGQVATAKALTGLFYCLTAAAVVYGFNAAFIVHWPLAILVAVLGSLFFVAVGLLLGTVIELRQQFVLWGFVAMAALLLPFFLWLTSELLPDSVATVVRWTPAAALGRAFQAACWRSARLGEYGPPLAYLAGGVLLVLGGVTWLMRRADR